MNDIVSELKEVQPGKDVHLTQYGDGAARNILFDYGDTFINIDDCQFIGKSGVIMDTPNKCEVLTIRVEDQNYQIACCSSKYLGSRQKLLIKLIHNQRGRRSYGDRSDPNVCLCFPSPK